jgi:hypothetical protein
MIPIYLKISNKRYLINVNHDMNVSDFKNKYFAKFGYSENAKLIFSGKIMKTGSLFDYGVTKECCINIMGKRLDENKQNTIITDSVTSLQPKYLNIISFENNVSKPKFSKSYNIIYENKNQICILADKMDQLTIIFDLTKQPKQNKNGIRNKVRNSRNSRTKSGKQNKNGICNKVRNSRTKSGKQNNFKIMKFSFPDKHAINISQVIGNNSRGKKITVNFSKFMLLSDKRCEIIKELHNSKQKLTKNKINELRDTSNLSRDLINSWKKCYKLNENDTYLVYFPTTNMDSLYNIINKKNNAISKVLADDNGYFVKIKNGRKNIRTSNRTIDSTKHNNLVEFLLELDINDIEYTIQEETAIASLKRLPCDVCKMEMNYCRVFDDRLYCNKCMTNHFANNLVKIMSDFTNFNEKLFLDVFNYASPQIVNQMENMMENIVLPQILTDIIVCPHCSEQFEYNGSYSNKFLPATKINGNPCIRNNTVDSHYVANRIKCIKCDKDFCKLCPNSKNGYHTGFTCEEYYTYLSSPDKCKFCMELIIDGHCETDKCYEYSLMLSEEQHFMQCQNTKDINSPHLHPNHGFDKYELCLKCVEMENEDCFLCMGDELRKQPCIKLDCGHIFHKNCIDEKLTKKHHTDYVVMNYIKCPVCFYKISHDSVNDKIVNDQQANRQIEELIIQHKRNNGLDDPIEKIVDKLRFYKCDECSDIYYGGEAECDELVDLNEDKKEIKKICFSCNSFGKATCDKHGSGDNIMFKCSYCCDVAVWFCTGDTHFCQPCHINAFKLPPKECAGPGKCVLGMEHPKNEGRGSQFPLGCKLCLPDEFLAKLKWDYAKRGRH